MDLWMKRLIRDGLTSGLRFPVDAERGGQTLVINFILNQSDSDVKVISHMARISDSERELRVVTLEIFIEQGELRVRTDPKAKNVINESIPK